MLDMIEQNWKDQITSLFKQKWMIARFKGATKAYTKARIVPQALKKHVCIVELEWKQLVNALI